MSDCEPCLAVPGCVFVKYEEESEVCQSVSAEVSSDPVSPKLFFKSCDGPGEDPNNPTTTTPSDTTTDPKTTTTTITTSTTTISTTTPTIQQPPLLLILLLTQRLLPLQSPPVLLLLAPQPLLPLPPHQSLPPQALTRPFLPPQPQQLQHHQQVPPHQQLQAPPPAQKLQNQSLIQERVILMAGAFFGGILLTLGLAAIGLVGFKYYRLRSGTGGNYNRF